MAFLIPNNVLDTLKCDSCCKLLSVTPVKVFPDGRKTCGRCNTDKDAGVISNYNTIAERSIFKCINRFDGCQELLNTSQVIAHEEICKAKNYTCPVCVKNIPTYLMINHFATNHNEMWLKSPYFIVKLVELDLLFLYNYEDYLLFFRFTSTKLPNDDFLNVSFNCLVLREFKIAKTLKTNVLITLGQNIINKQIKCFPFPSVDQNDLRLKLNDEKLLTVMFSLEMQESNIILPVLQKINSTFQNSPLTNYEVNHFLSKLYFEERDIHLIDYSPLFKVLKGSTINIQSEQSEVQISLYCFMCSSTNDLNSSIVFVCGQFYCICLYCLWAQKHTEYFNDIDMHTILFFCKWKCGTYLNNLDIIQHETMCKKQVLQQCPVESCTFNCKLYKIVQHFQKEHPQLQIPLFGSVLLNLIPNCNSKQLIVQSNVYIFVDFIWQQPFWHISLSCQLPNVKPRAIILDKNNDFVSFIKESGIIRHMDTIKLKCYLTNTEKEEILTRPFYKQLNTKFVILPVCALLIFCIILKNKVLN